MMEKSRTFKSVIISLLTLLSDISSQQYKEQHSFSKCLCAVGQCRGKGDRESEAKNKFGDGVHSQACFPVAGLKTVTRTNHQSDYRH